MKLGKVNVYERTIKQVTCIMIDVDGKNLAVVDAEGNLTLDLSMVAEYQDDTKYKHLLCFIPKK